MKSLFISFSLISIFMFSCKTAVTPTATFLIKHKEETMPVWIHGNTQSKYIILAVHGGPGSNVLDFREYKGGIGFRKVEEDYLVAYWQQRASGQSKGANEKSLFTINQYVEDTDKVIDQLKEKYPNKEIVLFGHSWGGTLTSSYLADSKRRKKVSAWVNAAGVHNGTNLMQYTITDINNEADKRIAANQKVSYWTDVKNTLAEKPQHANRLAYSVTLEIPEVSTKVNNSDFDISFRALKSNMTLFTQIIKTDNTSTLSECELPTLMLWGKYDFAVSKSMQDEINMHSSAPVTKIDFNASGHYMMFHEPILFAQSLKDFISKL